MNVYSGWVFTNLTWCRSPTFYSQIAGRIFTIGNNDAAAIVFPPGQAAFLHDSQRGYDYRVMEAMREKTPEYKAWVDDVVSAIPSTFGYAESRCYVARGKFSCIQAQRLLCRGRTRWLSRP